MLNVQCLKCLKVKLAYIFAFIGTNAEYNFNFISCGSDPVKFIRLNEKLNKQSKNKNERKNDELMNKMATHNGPLHLHAIQNNNSITLRVHNNAKLQSVSSNESNESNENENVYRFCLRLFT